MRRLSLIAILAAGLAACTISPVISDPSGESGGHRYSDCRRSARDVCKFRESSDDGRKECVAEATYQCVTGGGAP